MLFRIITWGSLKRDEGGNELMGDASNIAFPTEEQQCKGECDWRLGRNVQNCLDVKSRCGFVSDFERTFTCRTIGGACRDVGEKALSRLFDG